MATHSGIFAWRIPWTEKLGRLQSVGSQRVRHDGACAHITDPHREVYSQQPRHGSLGSETDPRVNVEVLLEGRLLRMTSKDFPCTGL